MGMIKKRSEYTNVKDAIIKLDMVDAHNPNAAKALFKENGKWVLEWWVEENPAQIKIGLDRSGGV